MSNSDKCHKENCRKVKTKSAKREINWVGRGD